MDPNERPMLALRELADRFSDIENTLPAGRINRALGLVEGRDDADRMLALIMRGAGEVAIENAR